VHLHSVSEPWWNARIPLATFDQQQRLQQSGATVALVAPCWYVPRMPQRRPRRTGDEARAEETAHVSATFEEVVALDDVWDVAVLVTERHGRLVAKGLRVALAGNLPNAGLTARDLRRIRLGDAIQALENRERAARSRSTSLFPVASKPYALDPAERHPEIALAYLWGLREQPRSPIALIAKQWRIKRETARDWVFRAGRAGYLDNRLQGFAQAEPTEKLRTWARKNGRKLPPPPKNRRQANRRNG
jgi:hypothetical protein